MAISCPSLLWQPAFPRQSALALRCDTQECCREKKNPHRGVGGGQTWLRGLLRDGPRSWYPAPVLSAVEIQARSLSRASALPRVVSESCGDALCSRLKPPRRPLGKGWLAGHGHKQGKGFHGATRVYPEKPDLAINTSSEHHSPSSLMFCCYLLQTHSRCCYFYLLFFVFSPSLLLQLFTSCITEASQKEDGKKVGDLRKKVPGHEVEGPCKSDGVGTQKCPPPWRWSPTAPQPPAFVEFAGNWSPCDAKPLPEPKETRQAAQKLMKAEAT